MAREQERVAGEPAPRGDVLGCTGVLGAEREHSTGRHRAQAMAQLEHGVAAAESSGVPRLTALTEAQQLMIQEQLAQLTSGMDVLLIDTGAGISPNVTFFAAAADETMIVVSPEPTSLTDAYALIKVLVRQYRERRFKVLVNQAKSPREAAEVFGKLDVAVDHFLHVAVELVGAIPYDDYVHLAVMQQKALSELFPEAPAAQAFRRLAQQILQWPRPGLPKSSVQLVWQRAATPAGN